MEKEQEIEWIKAQNIGISVDLVAAAKQQLQFLAAVDRNRYLYEGPALEGAIYRYNACWLPMLAKHSASQISEGPLVVPLDCEWIWHCHRLNPVQYKTDCEKLYGKILDNSNVLSSVQDSCKRQTEETWNSLYPEEPYDLDLKKVFLEDISERSARLEKSTKYDLVSAVKRQSPFFYQVSRPHMNHDLFIKGAVARYKGFLHLIKRNREKSVKRFCVPTYDVDLIWHTHQLHPVSYCKDLNELMGKVLEHDDMDSDRTKGKKLDVGFSGTTKQWEETFGIRYWKAGAMHRGSAPCPVTTTPYKSSMMSKDVAASIEYQKLIQLPEVKSVEVLLECVEVRNLPEGHKGSLFVTFSKTQNDYFFNAKRRLSILSESGEKQVACFQCEPTGELVFELISHSPSHLPMIRTYKTLGSTSLSLQDFLVPLSKLDAEKWLEVVPSSGTVNSKPIYLRVAVSFTIPALAQRTFNMVRSRPLSKSSCFLPLPGKVVDAKNLTHVIDETGTKLISLQMRHPEKAKSRENTILGKEVIGITKSGKISTLAKSVGTGWTLMDSHWSLHREKNSNGDGHLFVLHGEKMVKIFHGRKLDYEPKHCDKHKSEQDFMTLVEFSAENPYGKAVALLDVKSGCVQVKEEWILVLGITLAFTLSDMLKKDRYDIFAVNAKEMGSVAEEINENHDSHEGVKTTNLTSSGVTEVEQNNDVAEGHAVMPKKSGGCGSGCGDVTRSEVSATVDKPFSVEYANDMPGSAFMPVSARKSSSTSRDAGDNVTLGETAWNMRGVSRSKGSLLRFMKEEIPGVTSPMVYIAMLFSWFAWHVEDHDLHSLNYLHMGAGKTWYGVPKDAAVAFEEVVRVQGYAGEINPLVTFSTLGEKTTVMSPEVFVSSGIPCCRLVQNAGEFVVTFPRAYHTGFSHGFNCAEAANIATPEWLRVAKDAAIRRASINYPPMVSHFQLLYDLALALCSRMPSRISSEPRSSRLKDKRKGEGDIVVKELFVQDVIQNNDLLHVLGKGSPIVLLPQSSSDLSVCSKLRVGSQSRVNPGFSQGSHSMTEEMKSSGSVSDGLMIDRQQVKGFYSVRGKLASPSESNTLPSLSGSSNVCGQNSKRSNLNCERESNVEGEGLSDQRLFSCVTCGILSFACVAIIQPTEEAARYLMSADCSFFNAWVVGSGLASEAFPVATGDPITSKNAPCTGLEEYNAPAGLYDVLVQAGDYQIQVVDQGNEVVSNTEMPRETSALGLLALNYGNSSDSEEDQVEPDVPVCSDEPNMTNCSLESRYRDQSASPPWRNPYAGTSGVHSPSSQGSGCENELCLQTFDHYATDGRKIANFKDSSLQKFDCSADFKTNNSASTATGFGKAVVPIQKTSTSFHPGCDEDSSRMHVFCLEHAVEVEQQLRSIGGVHILLLCHPDYPRIEDEAKSMAEELGISYLWNDMAFMNATKEDETRIQLALDSEEAIAGNGDWAVKLGINLFYSASLSRSHLYSKQMPYNSVVYKAFGRSSPASSPTRIDAYGRRGGKPKKVVAGKWCGKVWMSNQVHSFLVKRDPEEEVEVAEDEDERTFRAWAMPDENHEVKSEITRKTEKTVKKYARKRKMTADTRTTKKAKCFDKEDAVSDYSVDDNSPQQQRRLPKSEQAKHIASGRTKKPKRIETEEAVSDDSMQDDDSLKQNGRFLHSEQVKYVERSDVSDDSMGVESHQQHRRTAKSKQFKPVETDVVSDDSFEGSSHQTQRVLRSKTTKCTGRENLISEDVHGFSSHQQRRSISRSKQARARFIEREDTARDETPEDNFQQHKRILRNKQIKPETCGKMRQETPRQLKQGTAPLVKQGTRTPRNQQTPQQTKKQTPRLRNNQSEPNSFDLYAEEETEGGPSTRLRKRVPKPSKVPGTKPKEQQQTARKKAKNASAGKAQGGRNETKLKEEEAEFICDFEGCTMSFASKHDLSLHKRNICPVKGCGKKFFSHKYLVQHRRVHTDDRPLRCPWKGCKMTFKWAWARTEHIRVHTGARPYVCGEPGCAQTFRFVSDFSRHKRKTGHSVKKSKK